MWKTIYIRKRENNTGYRAPEPPENYAYYGKRESRENIYRPARETEQGEEYQVKHPRERHWDKELIDEENEWKEEAEVIDNQASSSLVNHVATSLRSLQGDRKLGMGYEQGGRQGNGQNHRGHCNGEEEREKGKILEGHKNSIQIW